MSSKLLKYQIGLAALGVFTIAIVIVVVVKAGPAKKDNTTYNAAVSIADKLNNYDDQHGVVPNDLAQAGVTNAPSTITYKQIDETSFDFCAFYYGESNNFSASDAISNVVTSNPPQNQTIDPTVPINFDNTFLSIDSTYHKGKNCQTININGGLNTSPGGINPGGQCIGCTQPTVSQTNPTSSLSNQLSQSRNAQRRSDVNTIINAIYQYSIDNNGTLPSSLTPFADDICATKATTCSGLVDLSVLTNNAKYLVRLPEDPQTGDTTDTHYQVSEDSNGKVTVSAPDAELSQTISVTR